MPTYRSISIALHSQFDIETIPEYHMPLPSLPPTPPHTSLPSSTTHKPTTALPLVINSVPPLTNKENSTHTVYIPSLPGSRFWLSYAVAPPVPAEWYFLFKLYVDGVGVINWCTGQEEGWRGKVMFGLFAGADGGWQRDVLVFGGRTEGEEEGRRGEGELEIRVFRASGRRRLKRDVSTFGEAGLPEKPGGFRLVNAGRAGSEQPKRFYKLALIDPIDQPFAKFRYCCHSWEQLRDLGLLEGEEWAGSEDGLEVIEPGEESIGADDVLDGHADRLHDDEDCTSIHDWDVEAHERKNKSVGKHGDEASYQTASSSPRRNSVASGTYIPRGAPIPQSNGSSQPRRCGPSDSYRLSIPPSVKLIAPEPTSRPLLLPQKKEFSSSTAYRPHPAYPLEEWTIQAPRPVRSTRGGTAMPPLDRRKGLGITGAGLMGVFASSWKRSASSAQAARKTEVHEGARTVSY
ncbi:hypothetical protein EKO04_011239 [Ascochyta lentis]|uniref:Uncharacterized protein n=1 Tax=Ascochyta lentis TaxID=205686 RepID=A0A8H7IUL8_9PLEO|nr:hypothetical protein EKO04_011239 [Ascochyta lentis]